MPETSYVAYLTKNFRGERKITTLNLFIRGLTLAGKFFLAIFLGKQLTDAQIGEWGIFTTSVSLSLYLVGLDFYTYSTRTILQHPIEDRNRYLRDQFIFYLISYAILFPFLFLLFVFKVMEFKVMIFFYIILVFEHLAQESYRTFVVFSKPVSANIILFLRTGLWSYLLLALWMLHFDEIRTLKSVFLFWICGGATAVLTAIYLFTKLPSGPMRGIPVDWKWIKQGVRVSLVYFLATISFKTIEFADRYFINYYHSKDMVGIYTFYSTMANMIEIFVQTTTIIIFSPMLINSFYKDKLEYHNTFKKFARSLFLYNMASIVILACIMYPVLKYVIQKPSFLNHLPSFLLLCLSEMVFNLTLIFHYILYVRKNDFSVVKATIAAAFTNILLNFALIPPWGINGAALATLLSFIMLGITKAWYSRNLPEGKYIIYLRFLKKRRRTS